VGDRGRACGQRLCCEYAKRAPPLPWIRCSKPLPTIRHLQPKFSIIFLTGPRGGISTLLNLRLKKIGRFEHRGIVLTNALSTASENKRLLAVICSDFLIWRKL
jgi:hypothetical protein